MKKLSAQAAKKSTASNQEDTANEAGKTAAKKGGGGGRKKAAAKEETTTTSVEKNNSKEKKPAPAKTAKKAAQNVAAAPTNTLMNYLKPANEKASAPKLIFKTNPNQLVSEPPNIKSLLKFLNSTKEVELEETEIKSFSVNSLLEELKSDADDFELDFALHVNQVVEELSIEESAKSILDHFDKTYKQMVKEVVERENKMKKAEPAKTLLNASVVSKASASVINDTLDLAALSPHVLVAKKPSQSPVLKSTAKTKNTSYNESFQKPKPIIDLVIFNFI